MSGAHIVGSAGTACGRFPNATVASLAVEALDAALADAGVGEDRVEAIFFSNALSGLLTGQECVRGQVALRHSRYGGIPTVNVENACASGFDGAAPRLPGDRLRHLRDGRRRRDREDVAPGPAATA